MIAAPVRAEGRPWRLGFTCLAGLALFFCLGYGLSLWSASARTHVPTLVFSWERRIPFLAWTIVPYMSTGFFYCGSFFLCRNRFELNTLAWRLLFAQVFAIACFVLFPLQFGLIRPQVDGVEGLLFHVLQQMDGPFNQAPSLHVAFTVILLAHYTRAIRGILRFPALLLLSLAGLSTLTTYQHHVIDVITGALLGLACLKLPPASWKSWQA